MMFPESWDPTRTWVFAVGVLVYQNQPGWSQQGRRDVDLMRLFRARGVSGERLVHPVGC
jgi:hypothetical protein